MIAKLRVVVDTNVLISALHFGGAPDEVLGLVIRGEIEMFISPFILDELERVLREKFKWSIENIARVIAKKYPDRAIAIWKKIAEGLIDQTKVRAYQSASEYLLKIHMLLEKLDRKAEFKAYIEDIRQTHARKYRLVEILDRMTGRPIADGQ